MSWDDLVILIATPAVIVGGVFVFIKVVLPSWRDPEAHPVMIRATAPPAWPYGDALWRATMRLLPANTVNFIVLLCAAAAIVLTPSEDPTLWPIPLQVLFLVWAAVAIVVTFSVAAFNWPRSVVPPALRDQEGLVQDKLRSRRKSSQR